MLIILQNSTTNDSTIPAEQQNPFNIDGSCPNDKIVYFHFYTLRPQRNDRHFEDIFEYIALKSKMGSEDFSPPFTHLEVNNAYCVANGTATHIFKTHLRAVNMLLHQDNYTSSRSHPSLFT